MRAAGFWMLWLLAAGCGNGWIEVEDAGGRTPGPADAGAAPGDVSTGTRSDAGTAVDAGTASDGGTHVDAGLDGGTGADDGGGGWPDAGELDADTDAADGAGGQGPDEPVWMELPAQNTETGAGWGEVLTDIVQHCPPGWVGIYYDPDPVTRGHETSHGIHAFLRNEHNHTGRRANGFYLLGDRAVIVAEPAMRKSDVAPYVPPSLRGMRYDLYVTGMGAWDDTPLYLWDEWVAYTNGTAVGIDLVERGLWNGGWRDACMGTVEFAVYATAVGMAVEDLDPASFEPGGQLRAFLAWHLVRSLDLFRRCARLSPFAWDEQDAYFESLIDAPDARPLRDFLRRSYGAGFTERLLEP